MPTITTEQNVKIDVDVEVFCATCGCGLCNETTVKGLCYPQLRVNVCPDCMKEKNDIIADLNDTIKQLEGQVESLQDEVNTYSEKP